MLQFRHLICLSFIFLLSCSDAAKEASETKVYPIYVTVTGLSDGGSIQIVESTSDASKTITADSRFILANYSLGEVFSIVVIANLIGKRCKISNKTGLITGAPADYLIINCLKQFSVSGNVTGLENGKLVLRLNSEGENEDLELTGTGAAMALT